MPFLVFLSLFKPFGADYDMAIRLHLSLSDRHPSKMEPIHYYDNTMKYTTFTTGFTAASAEEESKSIVATQTTGTFKH